MSSVSMLRAVLVDNDPLALRTLRVMLDEHPDITILKECSAGTSAISAIRSLHPDIVFIDVQLPDLSGFDVIKASGERINPEFILVTASTKFAVRAFEEGVADYLLKPYDHDRLHDVLEHIRRRRTYRRSRTARE